MPTSPISLSELESSPWATRFKADCLPSSYATALRYVADPDFRVEIIYSNERGPWEWAIVAASHDTDFWMDSMPTKKAARELCRVMGWKQLR